MPTIDFTYKWRKTIRKCRCTKTAYCIYMYCQCHVAWWHTNFSSLNSFRHSFSSVDFSKFLTIDWLLFICYLCLEFAYMTCVSLVSRAVIRAAPESSSLFVLSTYIQFTLLYLLLGKWRKKERKNRHLSELNELILWFSHHYSTPVREDTRLKPNSI